MGCARLSIREAACRDSAVAADRWQKNWVDSCSSNTHVLHTRARPDRLASCCSAIEWARSSGTTTGIGSVEIWRRGYR